MKTNIFQGLSSEVLKKRRKMVEPSFVKPMLAVLTDDYFSNNEWIYEHKFDGIRCIVVKYHGKIHLFSRNHRVINQEYPELVAAFEKQSADNFVIDGEIVAREKKGIANFQLLQGRINMQRVNVKEKVHIGYCIFDVIYVDGYDVCKLPLLVRKQLLKKLLRYNKVLVYAKHKRKEGIKFFKQACAAHWEGLIAKRIDSVYQVGKRSSDWLKFKCIMEQELIIAGYTTPKGSREYFGALLVGYYDKKGKLTYAGKVGTGFSKDTLVLLGKKFKKIIIKKCPFAVYNASTKDVHWVKPTLVAEFQFAQWTKDGKLRVGRYKGLRTDKSAKEVVKETPKALAKIKKI